MDDAESSQFGYGTRRRAPIARRLSLWPPSTVRPGWQLHRRERSISCRRARRVGADSASLETCMKFTRKSGTWTFLSSTLLLFVLAADARAQEKLSVSYAA